MSIASVPRRSAFARFAAVAGPGAVVMLADTDAGSIITAAQSGAEWGYRLLLLQLALVPVLYLTQELSVRLGIVTGRGHAELISRHFGRSWAWLSVATLMLACAGALLTELSGLAGVGALFGVPAVVTIPLIVVALCAMVFTGSYLSVERVAVAVGAFELVFLFVAWKAGPGLGAMTSGAFEIPLANPKYLYLVAANIGAVIMPWMVFYQQSAVVEKGLTVDDLPAARLDTAFGALVTQIIMAAVLVTTAAVLGKGGRSVPLDTVQGIADAITPALGLGAGRLLFALGMSGAAVVATIVVTLTAARTLGEALGVKHHLAHPPREAPWFYAIYTATLVVGGGIVMSGTNLVALSVGVQVLNALLLPLVLGLLFLLARRLPAPHRLRGSYAALAAVVIAAVSLFGLYAGIAGLLG